MRLDQFPAEIRPYIVPQPGGSYIYRCLACGSQFGIEELLYTCPGCGSVLLIEDTGWERLSKIPGELWRKIFDYRAMLTMPAMKGIYRFHELLGSVIPLEDVVYLGVGHTPVVAANGEINRRAGQGRSARITAMPQPRCGSLRSCTM